MENFSLKIMEDISPFCGLLFWTCSDVSSGFQSQSGQTYLHLAEAYLLHIPWDWYLVQHLPTSLQPAWQLSWFSPTYLRACIGGARSGLPMENFTKRLILLNFLQKKFTKPGRRLMKFAGRKKEKGSSLMMLFLEIVIHSKFVDFVLG